MFTLRKKMPQIMMVLFVSSVFNMAHAAAGTNEPPRSGYGLGCSVCSFGFIRYCCNTTNASRRSSQSLNAL